MLNGTQRTHTVMKLPSLSALLLLALLCVANGEDRPDIIKARTVYHPDGTRTESINDPSLREQREFTYDKNGVLVSKKIYLLNEKGQTMQGNIYDGRDVLKARAQFLFDELGRMSEERLTTLQGEVYQRIIFGYDAKGDPLPPKSQTYNVQAPDMKAAVVDFTKTAPQRGGLDRSQGAPAAPGLNQNQGNVPRLPPGGLPPITVDMNPGEPQKMRSIWQKMFSKDKKDEKK